MAITDVVLLLFSSTEVSTSAVDVFLRYLLAGFVGLGGFIYLNNTTKIKQSLFCLMEDYSLIRILVLRQHLDIGEKEKSSIILYYCDNERQNNERPL